MHSGIPDRRVRRLTRVVGLLALAGAGLGAGPAALVAQSTPALDSTVRPVGTLKPGDEVNIGVHQDKEISGRYVVDATGRIHLLGIGSTIVAGLDPAQLEQRLKQVLTARGFTNPDVVVQPLFRVSVLGEVGKPALYSVEPGTTLIQLLTLAGGPSDRAALDRTRVVRGDSAYTVNLETALSGSGSGRIVLNSNDIVVVPMKRGMTRETLGIIISGTTALVTVVNLIVNLRR